MDPSTARLPSGATVRDVMDDQGAWDEVVRAAGEVGVADGEAQVASRLAAHLDAPAGQLVDALTPFGLVAGGEALHARLDGLLAAPEIV